MKLRQGSIVVEAALGMNEEATWAYRKPEFKFLSLHDLFSFHTQMYAFAFRDETDLPGEVRDIFMAEGSAENSALDINITTAAVATSNAAGK